MIYLPVSPLGPIYCQVRRSLARRGKASTPSGQAGGAPTPSGSGLPSGGSAGQF